MSKLRQVLKLSLQGKNKLQIKKATGVSRNTVKKYLRIMEALKIDGEQVSQLPDKELDELFCKEPEPVPDDRLSRLLLFFKDNDK